MLCQSNYSLKPFLVDDLLGVFVTCDGTTSKESSVCIDPI
jgi:hypothetical protein